MFFKIEEGKNCILVVYIDDIILIGDHIDVISRIKISLMREFKVNDLEKCYCFENKNGE